MIRYFNTVDELKEESSKLYPNINVSSVAAIDFPFLDYNETFTMIHIPVYKENSPNFVFIAEKHIFVSGTSHIHFDKKFKELMKKKHGESTFVIYQILKNVLRDYSREFVRIRESMNSLDIDPIIDSIEDTGRQLRKLTDRMESLLQIIIEIKTEEVHNFDIDVIPFDYEILNTETRYWLERCRSHVYRIASLRTKSEMKANKELNDTMKKLTVIMTFLTIASIVVNVPGTVGAIFGIPALSDAYFKAHTQGLVIALVLTTVLSILLGYLYWKSLGLSQPS